MNAQVKDLSSTEADKSVFTTGSDTKNLPMVIETKGSTDLINRDDMDDAMLATVAKRASEHNITDTAANLYYGAATQKELNGVLDSLLEGLSTEQAGLAGLLAVELNDSINLLKLEETKKQIINGQGKIEKIFSGVIEFFGGIANYMKYMWKIQDQILKKFLDMEGKYNNRIVSLTSESDNLDALLKATVNQIASLRIDIAAGEDILKAARENYAEKAKIAVEKNDTLELQAVRDFYLQITQFDTRFLQLKQAYVEASAVTIPRVRRSQEAITIEIDGIVRGVLFVIPKLKSSIVELSALYKTKEAQKDRKALDDVESRLNRHTSDILEDVATTAKQSQGLALQRAEELQEVVKSVITAINADRENEKQSAQNRREAEKLLQKLKDEVDTSIKNANIDAANEKI